MSFQYEAAKKGINKRFGEECLTRLYQVRKDSLTRAERNTCYDRGGVNSQKKKGSAGEGCNCLEKNVLSDHLKDSLRSKSSESFKQALSRAARKRRIRTSGKERNKDGNRVQPAQNHYALNGSVPARRQEKKNGNESSGPLAGALPGHDFRRDLGESSWARGGEIAVPLSGAKHINVPRACVSQEEGSDPEGAEAWPGL